MTFLKTLYERALQEFKYDFVFMWEDMSFKNGPLISPALFRTFMRPHYREMTDFYKQMGAPYVTVDSDGDVTQLIPLFVEGGVDGLLPFEVAAGMDVRQVREGPKNVRGGNGDRPTGGGGAPGHEGDNVL